MDDTEANLPSTPLRRQVLRAGAVGAALAGGSTLAGCSAESAGAPAEQDAGGAQGGSGGTDGNGIPVADVPVGGGTVIAADKVVVTQPTEGSFKAFEVTCPHQGCAVSMVTSDGIICPCHGSVFDVATGERTAGPAERGLTPRAVTVSGDRLTLA